MDTPQPLRNSQPRPAFDPEKIANPPMGGFVEDELSKRVIGAAIEVHRHLGAGHLESAYENALSIEFGIRGIEFERQVPIALLYKGHVVGESRLDLVVEHDLIVELKAVESFAPVHLSQVISYLRVAGKKRALLINFNVSILKDGIKRISL